MKYRIILLLMFLTGCGNTPPVPTDHFYRLPPVDVERGPALTDKMLQVQPLRAEGLLRERGIIYVDSAASVELERYRYHLWHEQPGVLVARHLADYLRSAAAADLITSGRGTTAGWIINGDLHEFMQVRGSDGNRVVISLELRLFNDRGMDSVLQQLYKESEAVNGTDITDVVAAFDRGLDRIYGRFLDDARKAAGS